MARMPTEQRFGFGERRQIVGADQALHRDAAQIGDFEIVARLQCFGRLRIEPKAETRRFVHHAEKDALAHRAERMGLGRRKQRIAHFTRLVTDLVPLGAALLSTMNSPPIT